MKTSWSADLRVRSISSTGLMMNFHSSCFDTISLLSCVLKKRFGKQEASCVEDLLRTWKSALRPAHEFSLRNTSR